MSIELATKFAPYTDEMFSLESKKSMLTNEDFNWEDAKTVKVYKVGTTEMTDYGRNGPKEGNWSRYGAIAELDATTEEFTLKRDRSFTFVIDRMDQEETVDQLAAGSALARQQREVVIPEVDAYTFGVMCENAGTKATPVELTTENIYDEIIKASEVLDEAMVPSEGRVLLVTPEVHRIMKKCPDITMETNIGNELRIKGVIGRIDGAHVLTVPSNRLPEGFGFMLAHKSATVAPTKLQSYKIHEDAPGISGFLVEGRIYYDAFVLENKQKAIYYQAVTA